MSFEEGLKKYKWPLVVIGVLAIVALLAVYVSSSPQSDSTASLDGMTDEEAQAESAAENGLVLDESGRVIPAVDGGSGTSGSSSSGSSSSGQNNPPSTDPEVVPPPAPEGAVMTAKIMYWDDTADSSAEGCQILIGGHAWTPGSAESDSADIENLPYDAVLEMIVLPNGSGGDRFTVPVMFTSVMEPGSEQDAIHVEISDGQVRVIGNPVENFDARFDRS